MTNTAIPFLTDNFKEIMVLLGSFVALTLLVNIISRINILLKVSQKFGVQLRVQSHYLIVQSLIQNKELTMQLQH